VTPWLVALGEVVAVSVAVLTAGRTVAALVRHQRLAWDAEVLHLAMAVAMAGMLSPSAAVVPSPVWLAVFAASGGWFAWRSSTLARRQVSREVVGGGLVHVGGCAAMVFMFLVVPSKGSMAAMADLICGARMVGMPASGTTGCVPAPLVAVIALGLGALLVVGAACLRPPRFARAATAAMTPGSTFDTSSASLALRRISLARLGRWAQLAMCLTMTVMLVAVYR
jgi:Domain of unknown function (DUF5134)